MSLFDVQRGNSWTDQTESYFGAFEFEQLKGLYPIKISSFIPPAVLVTESHALVEFGPGSVALVGIELEPLASELGRSIDGELLNFLADSLATMIFGDEDIFHPADFGNHADKSLEVDPNSWRSYVTADS